MSIERILSEIRRFDGILEVAPAEGSDALETSWGDHFFYFAPDGAVPNNRQPYVTIITKDYPEDSSSHLNGRDRWRLNIHVGAAALAELIGKGEEKAVAEVDYSVADVVLPHPLYADYGWICIVNPGPTTTEWALEALRSAHLDDRRRVERRTAAG